jgi:hypothetical protein
MPRMNYLPSVVLNGTAVAESRPPQATDLLHEMTTAVDSLLRANDEQLLRSGGVAVNGVVGHAHQGRIADRIKAWGHETGNRILIDADIDVMTKKVNYVRNRFPQFSLTHPTLGVRAQAQALLTYQTVNGQAGS